MMQVNVQEAQNDLLKLISLIQSGQEDSVVFTQGGKAVARMEGCQEKPNGGYIKFGVAKGELNYSGDFDECNDEIAEMFGVKT